MTPESYNKATPMMKEIEAIKSQISAVKTASVIKIEVGNVPIGFNLSTVGEAGMTKCRTALLEVLEERKKSYEDELKAL